AAHRGCDGDADPLALVLDIEPGVRPRLMRRGHDQLREPVHTPRLLALDPLRRLEVLRLASERDREAGGVERRDRASSPSPCDELLPTRPYVVTQRRYRAQTCDHDSPTPVGAHQPSTSLGPPSTRITPRRDNSTGYSRSNGAVHVRCVPAPLAS